MGRPPTKPITLKDGFYIEVRNKLDRSGIKMRRDTEEQMLQMIDDYKKSKVVVVLGESKNGKWVNDLKKKKARADAKRKAKAEIKLKEAIKKKEASVKKKELAAQKKAETLAKKKAAAAAKKKK